MASTTSVGGAGVGAGAGAGAEMSRSAAASGATMPVLGAGKRRRDGRKLNQLRPFVAQQGFINRADGSAKLSVGDSSVIVGVYGPMKPKAARMERPDEAVIAVSVTTSDGGAQGPAEAELASILLECVSTVILKTEYPRTLIEIVVQIVTDDGSMLPLAVNCAMLALIDAGVPLTDQLSAVSCGVLSSGDVCMDLLSSEEEAVDAVVTLVRQRHAPASEGIVGLIQSGSTTDELLDKAIACATKGCVSCVTFLGFAASKKVEAATGVPSSRTGEAVAKDVDMDPTQ